jgi:glycerol-3-phosphate dehydrogenase (NAD(P)+)
VTARVAVVGATSWGTTLAALLSRNGHAVRLLCRTDDEAAKVYGDLPDTATHIETTGDAAAALAGADAVLIAVPSQTVRANARRIRHALGASTLMIHASKGLERGSGKRVSVMLLEELPQLAPERLCVLSGPNLAPEIRRGLPAASVVGGTSGESVGAAQRLFHSGAFRTYGSLDVAGVEYGGALKNVIAIAAGIADGLRLGDNAKAGIITRGLAEVTRLGVAAGARPETFAGLAGVGDVMATCYSALSRNRRAGEAIGGGASVDDAIASAGGVVEGIDATAAACDLGRSLGVEMPIADALRSVLFEGSTPADAIRRLLEREATNERR